MADPKIITSPLSGPFTEGDVTVDVQIYRLEDTKWSLEVIDNQGTSIVWDDLFDTGGRGAAVVGSSQVTAFVKRWRQEQTARARYGINMKAELTSYEGEGRTNGMATVEKDDAAETEESWSAAQAEGTTNVCLRRLQADLAARRIPERQEAARSSVHRLRR
jgi:hypothetical protein